MGPNGREYLMLAVLAAAFGWVEGAVAHYLRLLYYPGGFTTTLAEMGRAVLAAEISREFATLALIAAAAALARGGFVRRAAAFVWVFGIWDIVYYAALFVFERWPRSPLDMDVLFLIPLPWFAPVAAPIAISAFGIACAAFLRFSPRFPDRPKLKKAPIALFSSALVLWLASFLQRSLEGRFPATYSWALFAAGMICAITGFAMFAKGNAGMEKQ